MIDRLRAGFMHTALGPAMVIWGFGYVLVDIVAYLLGRSAPGLNLLFSIPMFILGVGQTIALDRLRDTLLASAPGVLRWALLIVAIGAATALQASFDLYWLRWVALGVVPGWQEWALAINLQRLFAVGILYLWTFCLALTLLWAIRIRSAAAASAARAASAEAAAAKAETAALRLQLNPHFMFNTLNSISSLVILNRKDDAEEMIDRLCEFLRSSLYSDPMADVPLSQEIESIDSYLGIEATRFDELEIDIDVRSGVEDALVPNFILQPLVENAIKHGVAALKGPAMLTVRGVREGDMLTLTVTNNSPATVPPGGKILVEKEEADPAKPRSGIGLANVRQRLANRYGARGRLETEKVPGGYRAVIRMPFVEGSAERAG